MGRTLKELNKFHDKVKKKKNGDLLVFFSDKFGVSWDEVLIVLRHLDSWTRVPEQERLDVDVQDWLVTSEIVNRMWKEIEQLRKKQK